MIVARSHHSALRKQKKPLQPTAAHPDGPKPDVAGALVPTRAPDPCPEPLALKPWSVERQFFEDPEENCSVSCQLERIFCKCGEALPQEEAYTFLS